MSLVYPQYGYLRVLIMVHYINNIVLTELVDEKKEKRET